MDSAQGELTDLHPSSSALLAQALQTGVKVTDHSEVKTNVEFVIDDALKEKIRDETEPVSLNFCEKCYLTELPDDNHPAASSSKGSIRRRITRVDRIASRYGLTRKDLEDFLGPSYNESCHILDEEPGHVTLMEVFAGAARTSKVEQSCGGYSVQIGYAYGHDLNLAHDRACVKALAEIFEPEDIWVSWPCTFVGSWSRYNISRGGNTAKQIQQGRKQTRKHLALFRDLFMMQSKRGLGCHGENPEGSLAFEDPILLELMQQYSTYWAKFPQCCFGLKHPETEQPMLKVTEVISTDRALVETLNGFSCSCEPTPGRPLHARVSGTYQGRDVSSWAEDYPLPLAKQIVKGLRYARQDRHLRHRLTDDCFAGTDRKRAATADPYLELLNELGLTKDYLKRTRTDEDGRTGASGDGKEKVTPTTYPTHTTSEMSTWLNSLEPDFLEHGGCLEKEGKLIYIYKNRSNIPTPNCSAVWARFTPYGRDQAGTWLQLTETLNTLSDTSLFSLPRNFETLVCVYDISRIVNPKDPKSLQAWLKRLHIGLGHASNSEMHELLKTAGASTELLQACKSHVCHHCLALTSPLHTELVRNMFLSILTTNSSWTIFIVP